MTYETLKAYRPMRAEVRQLNRLIMNSNADLNTFQGTMLLEKYAYKRDTLIDTLKEIEQTIDALAPAERMILRARYIEGRSWTATCRLVNYSRRQAFRIHDEALRKILK